MKILKSLAAAVIVLAFIPAIAQAEKVTTRTTKTHVESYQKTTTWVPSLSGVYVAGQVGYNDPNGDLLKENVVYAGAIGYRFSPFVRVEGEYSYRRNDVDNIPFVSGRSRVQTLMANAWYDYANDTKFTPYIGGGIGAAHDKAIGNVPLTGFSTSSSDNAFVYQLGGGVAYSLCKNMALTADYRYINTSKFDDVGAQYIASEYRAGVRYSF